MVGFLAHFRNELVFPNRLREVEKKIIYMQKRRFEMLRRLIPSYLKITLTVEKKTQNHSYLVPKFVNFVRYNVVWKELLTITTKTVHLKQNQIFLKIPSIKIPTYKQY